MRLTPALVQVIGKTGAPLLVGEGHHEQVLVALFAGELRGPGIGADHEDVVFQ